MAGAKTGGEGEVERSAKAKTHTQTKDGIPVANQREPWALESDNLCTVALMSYLVNMSSDVM